MAAGGRGQTSRRRRSGGRSGSGWLWGVGGLMAGLLVAVFVHLHHQSSQRGIEGLDTLFEPRDPESPRATERASEPEGSDRPTFEFYRLLPEQEVAVPDDEPARTPEAGGSVAESAEPLPSAGDAADAPGAGGGQYLLQAGSFRSHGDADQLKASLALIGVEARIQRVELAGGETWHRVRIGPFSDQGEVNTVKRRLSENNVETILLRSSGG